MYDYRQLEALGAVIEHGGFDRAADVLGLTQSAVTQRVKQLETLTGKPLLIRSNPPVPTEAGIPVFLHFKKVRLLEEELDSGSHDGVFGTALSLGVNASTLGSWFLPVLSRIMGSTLVDLHVGEAWVVHRLLQNGDIAGCISLRQRPSRGCYVDYLGNLVLRCFATEDFKKRYFPDGITPERMKTAPAVLFHRESQMMQRFQKKVLNTQPFEVPTHIIPSQSEYLQMISSGAAYGFLPEPLFNKFKADKGFIDLSPDAAIIIPQYWHRWGINSKQMDFVTSEIKEQARLQLLQE